MSVEADKAPDQQSASWGPRKVNGVFLVQKPAGSSRKRSQCFRSNPNAGESPVSQLEGSQAEVLVKEKSALFFYSGLQQIR